MKDQALFSSKDKSKKLKCRLLQFLFGALRVKQGTKELQISQVPVSVAQRVQCWLGKLADQDKIPTGAEIFLHCKLRSFAYNFTVTLLLS